VRSGLGTRTATAQVEEKENKDEPKNKRLHGLTSEYGIQDSGLRTQDSEY
jgi:hypothetical protein